MTRQIFLSNDIFIRKWMLSGIPVLFITGSFMHFIYELTGKSVGVGIFAPVNESVWEHLKMPFWPVFIWWFIGYLILSKSSSVTFVQWFVSFVAAELACPIIILSFYYTYTGALGIESLILDAFSMLLGLTVAQILALHIYEHANSNYMWFAIALLIFILMAAAFVIFTFQTPQIPLFKDSLTGKYGI